MITGGMILYICNRGRCQNCRDECKHTTEIEYAVNPTFEESRFEEKEGDWWEKLDGSERLCKHS